MENLALLGYIAAVVSATGIILNAKKIMACWPIWIFSNFLWITYSGIEGDVPSIVLWSLFTLFNIYGWWQWKKDRKPKGYPGGKYNYIADHPMDFPARRNGKILRKR